MSASRRGSASSCLTALDHEVGGGEDRTDVPRSHAEALLEVAPGTVTYERSRLRLRNHEALIDRFITPGPLDFVTVEFAARVDADTFLPPVWFGSEVTDDDSYSNRMMAIVGKPRAPEAPLSNAALESMLDLLEGGRTKRQPGTSGQPSDGGGQRVRAAASSRRRAPCEPASQRAGDAHEAGAAAEPPKPNEAVARPRSRRPTVHIAAAPAEAATTASPASSRACRTPCQRQPSDKDERFGS